MGKFQAGGIAARCHRLDANMSRWYRKCAKRTTERLDTERAVAAVVRIPAVKEHQRRRPLLLERNVAGGQSRAVVVQIAAAEHEPLLRRRHAARGLNARLDGTDGVAAAKAVQKQRAR